MARTQLSATTLGKSADLDVALNSLAFMGITATARVKFRDTNGNSTTTADVYVSPTSATPVAQPLDADDATADFLNSWVERGSQYNLEITLGAGTRVIAFDAPLVDEINEFIDDRVASLLVAGTGIGLAYNDAANTLTVSATGGGLISSIADTPTIDLTVDGLGQLRADIPITAPPQLAQLALGVAPQSPHMLTIGSGSAFGNSFKGIYWTDYPTFTDQYAPYHAQRFASETLTVRKGNFNSIITARSGGQLNGGGWISCRSTLADQSGVKELHVVSIDTAGLVTVDSSGASATPHGFAAGERALLYGASLTAHNDTWIVKASPAPTSTTFAIQHENGSAPPASSSTGGTVSNRPFMAGYSVTVIPQFDRSITTGGAIDADDVNGYVIFNAGPGRATDANYVTANTAAFPSSSAFITGFTVDCPVDFAFKVGAWTIGQSNSLGAFPGNQYGAAFDCSTALLATGAHAMRVMNNGPIVSRIQGGTTFKHLLSLGTSNQVLFADDASDVGVWGNGAQPVPTNTGGRVFQLAGGNGAAPTDNIPELKLYANPQASGADKSSKAEINLFGFGADGTTQHRFHIKQDGAVPWTILGTTSTEPLMFQVANVEVMRLHTDGSMRFPAISSPTAVASKALLYAKTVTGLTSLYTKDSAGTELLVGGAGGGGGGGDATTLDGIDSTGFAILAGQAGGQVLKGGTAAGDNLTLQSTVDASRGSILVNDPIAMMATDGTGVIAFSKQTVDPTAGARPKTYFRDNGAGKHQFCVRYPTGPIHVIDTEG
jgi:hypothetical protein